MPNPTPHDAIIIIGLLVALFILNRYAAHLEYLIRKRDRDRTRKAREEHLARLARMRNYSRRAGTAVTPPPDVTYTGWTPPAGLTTEVRPMHGIGDTHPERRS